MFKIRQDMNVNDEMVKCGTCTQPQRDVKKNPHKKQ